MTSLVKIVGVFLALTGAVSAQASEGVKIGIIGDMSGPYAALNGEGAIVAAKLAIEDIGGDVLGHPVTIVTGDNQNKPDIATALARKFYDNDNVTAILDGGNSASALAVQFISKERKKIFLISGGTTADVTGKACSPYSIHWLPDTYALATASAQAILHEGGKSWFFVAANYVFGQDLERYATATIELEGGQVLGSVRHPFNTPDFSSYLLQGQSSGAQVIALANAGVGHPERDQAGAGIWLDGCQFQSACRRHEYFQQRCAGNGVGGRSGCDFHSGFLLGHE